MATKTKPKPNQDDPNRIQDDYEQKFDDEKRDNRKSDTEEPGSLSEQEENFSDSEETGDESESQEREQIGPETTEESTESGSGEFQYTSGGGKKKRKGKRNWKRIAFGGGILGLVGGSVIMLYYFLPLLKVAHVLNNLESRFMGVAANAIEHRAERLLSRYMRNYVFPSVSGCGRVVSIDCNPNFDLDRGVAGNLYRNWSNARIEEKLFTNHGILIERSGGGNNYSITTRSGHSVEVNGQTFEFSDLTQQRGVGAAEVRRELKNVLENETFWKRLMLRHSVRKMAASKYNVRWCTLACNLRDRVDTIRGSAYSALERLKLKIVERTIGPFSDRLGLYLSCAITDCNNLDFARQRSQLINRAVEELGEEEIERIVTEVSDRRLSQVFVDKIVSKVFGVVAGRGAAAAVPLVGWIYALDAINEIDTKLYNGVISQYLADNTASQYAEFYLTYRTNFDEGVGNQLSLDEVGAQSQLLDGLEGSLVFQRDLGSGAGSTTAGINLFSPVNAQAEPYLCADDNPIPEGQLVCEERKVGKQSGYDAWRQSEEASLISGLTLGSYRCGAFIAIPQTISGDYCEPGSSGDILWFFDDIAHQVFRLFNSAIDFLSGAIVGLVPQELIDALGGFVAQITQSLLEVVFPYIESGTGPGRQVFDDLYAGADVVGNEFAKGFEDPITGELVGLGGRRLTDQEVEANLALYQQNQQDDFKNQSLFARIFSTSDPQSLMSRVALGTPASKNFSDMNRSLLAFLNPVRMVGSISGLLMSPSYAQANTYQGDPFGIHQYGYPVGDPTLDVDPNEITDEACAPGGSLYEAWIEGIEEQTVDGQIVQSTTNPCMLEYVTTNILGSWFTAEDDGAN